MLWQDFSTPLEICTHLNITHFKEKIHMLNIL
jgi:hypothetical protein